MIGYQPSNRAKGRFAPLAILAFCLIPAFAKGVPMTDPEITTQGPTAEAFTVAKQGERSAVLSLRLPASGAEVFEAMTGCTHLAKWMVAAGRSLLGCSADLRTGGSYRHEFGTPNGRRFVVYGDYLDVTPPERIVHTELYEGYDWPPVRVTTDFKETAGETIITQAIEYPSAVIRDEDFPNLEHSLAGYSALRAYLAQRRAAKRTG